MKKKMFLLVYYVFITSLIITSCNTVNMSGINEPTATLPTLKRTPSPTSTATPTPTSTPLPLPIQADNFSEIQLISSTNLKQNDFVNYRINKQGFKFESSGLPDGDYENSYFLWYQLLENGDLIGLQMKQPLFCGEHSYGVIKNVSCTYNRYYVSMVNITQQKILWTQYQPINMAGDELNALISELGIEGFIPSFGSGYNSGYLRYKWTEDKSQLVFPIGVVNSLLIKDVMTGDNLTILNGGKHSRWIGAISPDNSKLAYVDAGLRGGMDYLNIMDLDSQEIDFQFKVANSLTDLAWSDDGTQIAVGKSNGSINVFDLTTGNEIYLIERRFDLSETRMSSIQRMVFSHDGIKLAFTGFYYDQQDEPFGKFSIYDIDSRKELNTYPASFEQNGKIIWSGSDDYAITMTDFVEGKLILMGDAVVSEQTVKLPAWVDEYSPTMFTSWLSLNEDQTELQLIFSLFNDAFIQTYMIDG